LPKKIEGTTQTRVITTTTENGGEEQRDPRALSQVSPQNESFFEKLSAIPESEWAGKHTSVTVYRKDPPADPQRPDRTTYAFKKESAFSEDFVASRFGGGVYEYWFKEGTDLKSRGFFSIGGAPKPPTLWNVAGGMPQAPAVPGSVGAEKSPELVGLLKDMMDKLNSGASTEQLKATFRDAQDVMKTTYTESLKNLASKDHDGDMLDRMIKLGVLKTVGGSSSLIETITVLKELGLVGEKKEDLLDQIEKIKTIGDVLGWSKGGGGDDDWRISLARNLPDVLGGIERVTVNIVNAIQQSKGQPGASIAPAAAQPGQQSPQNANPPQNAAQPQNPQEVTPQAQQAALDAFIKTKLVQFFTQRSGKVKSDEVMTLEEVVNWMDHTAPEMVDYLSSLPADVVAAQVSKDGILAQITNDPDGKKWIAELLKEMKAEAVGAE
jgi:hypothetical protein